MVRRASRSPRSWTGDGSLVGRTRRNAFGPWKRKLQKKVQEERKARGPRLGSSIEGTGHGLKGT